MTMLPLSHTLSKQQQQQQQQHQHHRCGGGGGYGGGSGGGFVFGSHGKGSSTAITVVDQLEQQIGTGVYTNDDIEVNCGSNYLLLGSDLLNLRATDQNSTPPTTIDNTSINTNPSGVVDEMAEGPRSNVDNINTTTTNQDQEPAGGSTSHHHHHHHPHDHGYGDAADDDDNDQGGWLSLGIGTSTSGGGGGLSKDILHDYHHHSNYPHGGLRPVDQETSSSINDPTTTSFRSTPKLGSTSAIDDGLMLELNLSATASQHVITTPSPPVTGLIRPFLPAVQTTSSFFQPPVPSSLYHHHHLQGAQPVFSPHPPGSSYTFTAGGPVASSIHHLQPSDRFMFGAGSGVVGSSSSFLLSRNHQQYEQQEELSWVAAIRPPNDHHHHQQQQQHLNRDPARMFTAPTSSAVGYSSSSSTANYSLMMMQQPLGASSHHIPGATSLLGVGSSMDFRIVDPPPCRPHSGIWFILQASTNQAMKPFLPQVPKSYLRIKDGKMMVRLVIKYLVNKLGVDSESEVEVRCRGQLLEPNLTLQHVRDTIWSGREAETTTTSVTLLPHSSSFLSSTSTVDHVMLLQYGRSCRTKTNTNNNNSSSSSRPSPSP